MGFNVSGWTRQISPEIEAAYNAQKEAGMAIDWNAVLGLASTGTQVLGAVSQAATGTAGTGKLIGGTVISSGGGRVTIRTTTGRTVVIQRKKHRRYHARSGGGGIKSLLRQAMEFKMIAQAMK